MGVYVKEDGTDLSGMARVVVVDDVTMLDKSPFTGAVFVVDDSQFISPKMYKDGELVQ